MKTVFKILIVILVLLAILVACAAVYFFTGPQYALAVIVKDVQAEGLEGLTPHLTDEAAETVEKITTIAENPLLSTVFDLFADSEYLDILRSELQNVTWDVKDVMRGRENAQVIIAFDYKGEISGSVTLSMIRTDDGWKINGIHSPKIDGLDLGAIDFSSFGKIISGEGQSSEDSADAQTESDGFSFKDITLPDLENFSFEDIELPDLENFNFEDIKLPDLDNIDISGFKDFFSKSGT